jgi:hypothetical protein
MMKFQVCSAQNEEKIDLKGRKNEEPDEEDVVGCIGNGNCFWDNINGFGLQEERSRAHTERGRKNG